MSKPANDFPIRLNSPRAWRTYLGGSQLDALHGKQDGEDGHFPEEWIMSVVAARNVGREDFPDEGMSFLADEPSLSLKALLEGNAAYYLGTAHAQKSGASLGVLLKLIDSAERLTLQVHPDREKAMALFSSPFGKTECWHILGGHEVNGEKPCIYFGFKEGVTRESWKHLFDTQDIHGMLDAMQKFYVQPGDTVLIEGGMPHAIGAGCFLAEIQEPTDFTIRVERTTPSGFHVDDFLCHQGLGFDRMFDAFHYESLTPEEIRRRWFIKPRTVTEDASGSISTLIGYDTTDFFRLDELCVSGALEVPAAEAFSGLYVLDGGGTLSAGGKSCRLEKTAQFFVPAATGTMTLCADPGAPLRVLHFFGPREA